MAKDRKPSVDDRVENMYGHEAMDLKAREEMIRRGAKRDTPNLPMMDATFKPARQAIRRAEAGKGAVKRAKGGKVKSIDGIAKRGRTRAKHK